MNQLLRTIILWTYAVLLLALCCCPVCRAQSPSICRQNEKGQRTSKQSAASTAARTAAKLELEKAKAIVRRVEAEGDFAIYAKISPQRNFVARVDGGGLTVTIYRTSDGKKVSALTVDKDMGTISGVDISEDERFILIHNFIAHNRHNYWIYERSRPFVYSLSKHCPEGSLDDAISNYDRDYGGIVSVKWAEGSRYILVPSYDDKTNEILYTIRYDTRTGRVTRVRK